MVCVDGGAGLLAALPTVFPGRQRMGEEIGVVNPGLVGV